MPASKSCEMSSMPASRSCEICSMPLPNLLYLPSGENTKAPDLESSTTSTKYRPNQPGLQAKPNTSGFHALALARFRGPNELDSRCQMFCTPPSKASLGDEPSSCPWPKLDFLQLSSKHRKDLVVTMLQSRSNVAKFHADSPPVAFKDLKPLASGSQVSWILPSSMPSFKLTDTQPPESPIPLSIKR
ncbi:hypothetical protein BJ508DRAFT_84975 [Ascobolus immersus RN42]|uniref:Uncharacterized protein n=1 Tax=Ascobolus immersus RN42 TaxID=1160509 RepID=A0A3N4HDW8_ASCIM|nr:hypothetical protein BJ508DRAFT_84975 [Ascobolus immersus RN42]